MNRKKTMYYLKKIWIKARYSSIYQLVFDELAKVWIKIQMYYIIVLEGLSIGRFPHLETGFDEYEIGFLGSQDLKEISDISG